MKLKLDLHPLYNDSDRIEAALQSIIDEAVEKRAAEVEIIPGKGSGALKKSVLRFLDRPDVKSRYHRLEKDSDNWGRLFVHFRPPSPGPQSAPARKTITAEYRCFCCSAPGRIVFNENDLTPGAFTRVEECPSCGSPNKLTIHRFRNGTTRTDAQSGYE